MTIFWAVLIGLVLGGILVRILVNPELKRRQAGWEREERVSDKLREALEVANETLTDIAHRKDELEEALTEVNKVSYLPAYATTALWRAMPDLEAEHPNYRPTGGVRVSD